MIRSAVSVLLGGLVLFALVNAAAWFHLLRTPLGPDDDEYFVHRNSQRGIAIRSRIFNTDDVPLLLAYAASPGIRAHPVLHFAEGPARPHVTVGIEGIRYLPDWTDADVAAWLATPGGVYVFGGSTTFGHGVAGRGHAGRRARGARSGSADPELRGGRPTTGSARWTRCCICCARATGPSASSSSTA